jgi:hypothetical protein
MGRYVAYLLGEAGGVLRFDLGSAIPQVLVESMGAS